MLGITLRPWPGGWMAGRGKLRQRDVSDGTVPAAQPHSAADSRTGRIQGLACRMSVQMLRQLISVTEMTAGGLRVRLDPSVLQRACAEQGFSFARLATTAGLSSPPRCTREFYFPSISVQDRRRPVARDVWVNLIAPLPATWLCAIRPSLQSIEQVCNRSHQPHQAVDRR